MHGTSSMSARTVRAQSALRASARRLLSPQRAHRRQPRAWRAAAAGVQLGWPRRRPQLWCAAPHKESVAHSVACISRLGWCCSIRPLARRAGLPGIAKAASSGVRATLQRDSGDRVPALQAPACPGAPVAGAACRAAAGVRAARAEPSAGELMRGGYTAAQQQPDADLGRPLRLGWRSTHRI